MSQDFSLDDLHQHSKEYEDTEGVSARATVKGYWPAFRHKVTGEVFWSPIVPIHLLSTIPERYHTRHDEYGNVTNVDAAIEDGFIDRKTKRFYTRDQISHFQVD